MKNFKKKQVLLLRVVKELHKLAGSSDRHVQALAEATLFQVKILEGKGCPYISIQAWAYGAISRDSVAERSLAIGFQNIAEADRKCFTALMGIDEFQTKVFSSDFRLREIIAIAKSFSDRTVSLSHPNDLKFMEVFYTNLEGRQDLRTSFEKADAVVSHASLSPSMRGLVDGLLKTTLSEDDRGISQSLFKEVPGNKAPYMAIDGAALAQVQSSLLQRWL